MESFDLFLGEQKMYSTIDHKVMVNGQTVSIKETVCSDGSIEWDRPTLMDLLKRDSK